MGWGKDKEEFLDEVSTRNTFCGPKTSHYEQVHKESCKVSAGDLYPRILSL
jgi:hypothetical protein